MLFSSDNYADINKYYLNTYIKIKETGDVLYLVQNVTRTDVRGVAETGAEFVIYLDNENPYEIDYVLPHKSYFQYGSDACLLQRIPAKQYRRGLNGENTMILKLTRTGEFIQLKLDFAILKAFVAKQPFFTLTQAMAKGKGPEGTNHSYVLTPRLSYSRTLKTLFIDQTKIATISPDKTITFIHPIFKAEVQDFLNQSGELKAFTLK